jgi:hypothetical protein
MKNYSKGSRNRSGMEADMEAAQASTTAASDLVTNIGCITR